MNDASILTAKRVAIVVTTKCTLNCKLCSNHMPRFEHPTHPPLESVISDIDRVFELLSHVGWLQFVGGEIFMRKDMAQLYEYALKYKRRFDRLVLITNATIVPRADELAALKKYGDDCQVQISDYGPLSSKKAEFIAAMEQHGIPYIVKSYYGDDQHEQGWIDNTAFKDLGETDAQLVERTSRCANVLMENMVCLNGKLHRCCNSCFLNELGVVTPNANDFIDLNDQSITLDDKRKIAGDFYKHPRASCRICIGYGESTKGLPRYPAAEQV